MSADPMRDALRRLAAGESLSADDSAAAFGVIMRGDATAAQTAALLMALRVKGETAGEVAGAARALRDAMVPLRADDPASLLDTCGTGGGRVATFNISTASAFVAAGAGARVAKHGNRSFTTRCGSADVLEALGVRIEMPAEAMADVLERAGIVFMFAPIMHPAMRHVGPVRREISVPTMMNLLGPLANPAGAGRQVIGVSDASRLRLVADALAALGTVHAMVVHGEPGMDEISPMGPTTVLEVRGGAVHEWRIDPTALGIPLADAAALAGGSPAENAQRVVEVLEGKERGGARHAVLLNAAAAIQVAGLAADFPAAYARAGEAIDSGAARAALERLARASAPRG
ncbi:MAG TPA: anthranilate phosphoribosyltransferase [Gemmatimonadaceae bacterium]|nr:anthranilate phosphoribosyltransferase [Gemmatimonadaceae bacterium]